MSNMQLVNAGITLLGESNQPDRTTAKGNIAVIQRIDSQNSNLAAHLIMERQAGTAVDNEMQQLSPKIQASFDKIELRQLCFYLSVDFEYLNGDNRLDKTHSLVTYMKRRNRLPELVKRCAHLRPDTDWKIDDDDVEIVPKSEIAVVIDVAQPAVQKVANYLDDQGINANFLVFNNEDDGFFKVDDDWEQLTITFNDVMDKIKRKFPETRIHFFMAGPGALFFAMGCVWGTVDNATIYHYDRGDDSRPNTYYPVVKTTRKLRQITSK